MTPGVASGLATFHFCNPIPDKSSQGGRASLAGSLKDSPSCHGGAVAVAQRDVAVGAGSHLHTQRAEQQGYPHKLPLSFLSLA